MRSLLQMRQGQHPSNLPHQGIRPGVPPPRPPAGPPPDGPPPKHHNRHPSMMQGFGGVPDFSPMTSNAMDYQGFAPQQQMPRPGQPGWSLSHGMDGGGRGNQGLSGAGRPSTSQEPTLAAGMVWDDVHAAPSFRYSCALHCQGVAICACVQHLSKQYKYSLSHDWPFELS